MPFPIEPRGSRGDVYVVGEDMWVALRDIPQAMEVGLFAEDFDGSMLLHKFGAIKPTPGIEVVDCQAVADAVLVWIGASYKGLCNTGVHFRKIVVASRETANPWMAVNFTTNVGTRAGDQLPSSVTCAIAKSTNHLGRSYFGHFQAFPACVADVVGNRFDRVYLTALQAAFNALKGDLTTAGYPMGIISNTLGQIEEVVNIYPNNDTVDHQSTRLIGRGR